MLSGFYRAIARIRAVIQSRDLDRSLDAEIESHIRLRTEDYVSRGVLPTEAERLARIEFGGIAQLREAHREMRSLPFIDTIVQDLRYAFRGMRRNAAFTTFTILIAGLGIGASSTVFSMVNALLLRPLPFHDPGRLVWMSNGNEATSTQTEHYSDLRAFNRSFSDLAAFADWGAGNRELTGSGEPDRLTSVPVTANFFTLLEVQPALGRWFTTEECQGKYYAPPAMLLSYNFWHRRFASDPGIVGRKLTLDNQPVTVVGVLPKSFDFGSIFTPGTQMDIFVPWPELEDPNKPHGNTMRIIGRLKPGATIQSAQAELSILAKQLERQHPERNGVLPLLVPLAQHVSGASAAGFVCAGLCSRCRDADCLRQSCKLAIGKAERTSERNGDTNGIGSRTLSTTPADDHRERSALLLWGCARSLSSPWQACVRFHISTHSIFRFWQPSRLTDADWLSLCWQRSRQAYSSACCRRCRRAPHPFAKVSKMAVVVQLAVSSMLGSVTAW